MKKIITLFLLVCFGKLYSQSTTVYIPVVFHVVYGTAAENIPDAQILQHLQSLNFDFADTTCPNTYAPDFNTHIQFCLATVDPIGNPTNGITRTSTTITSFSTDNKVKYTAQGGHYVWNRNKYLNIWICDMGSSLLGYGQFPGGTAATDGVVSHYKYLYGGGLPYNLGKNDVHEIAHWLGLTGHPGGDCVTDGDGITDTPMKGTVYSCGGSTVDPCSGIADSILAKNFMQGSDDACKCFFTAGQAAEMWIALNGARASLLTSNGCAPAGIHDYADELNISVYPNPSAGNFEIRVNVPFDEMKISVFNSFGQKIESTSTKEKTLHFDLSGQPPGVYWFNSTAENFSLTKRLVVIK